ncbi:MAG: dimethyladenosine transferase [Actinobacteria bacterium]|uniref:Unannotated protein n=1 Tax=freshwater metagenome TaxID=449393 RepID=A0A6J7S0U7_9ZZZZ|nr:dimethyladenosine transferase [Actinomycetota bacterium]
MYSSDLVTVINTGERYVRSASIMVQAPATAIFELLAQPNRHRDFDGSGSVKDAVPAKESLGSRLALHDHFTMNMKFGVPYRMQNQVVEFEEGRLIAWRHMGKHRWRYELKPLDAETTLVTETFDARTAVFPAALTLMNAYNNNLRSIIATLPRLKMLAESTYA